MKTILVTGAAGFVGVHLCLALRRTGRYTVLPFDKDQPEEELGRLAERADMVFHLAGVNRPQQETEFTTGNRDLTRRLCDLLRAAGRHIPIMLSSSTQAALDNPYGRSKQAAEDAVREYHRQTGAAIYIYRFPNIFGKWSRPHYNTVVATFCHNVARDLPVQINNPDSPIRFVYIDDVVRACLELACRNQHDTTQTDHTLTPEFTITVGDLHARLTAFQEGRRRSLLPDLSDPLTKYLYSTFLSFVPATEWAHAVELRTDDRGWLFELIKSPCAGQIFVSQTKPGITRGHHYHDTKVEKFCVIQGAGIIRFRRIGSEEVIEQPVSGAAVQVVDIPPGYTHSIENTGTTDMITIFWANEIFDPNKPDTYFEKV